MAIERDCEVIPGLVDKNGISYKINGDTTEYGTISSARKQWLFDRDNKLIGLVGNSKESNIIQLGFITLSSDENQCSKGSIFIA